MLSKLVELEPGRLYWAPEPLVEETVADASLHHFVIEEEPQIRFGEYGVCHYKTDRQAAFGPPDIDQVVSFVRLCEDKLKEHQRMIITTKIDSSAFRANAAVFAGAWLALHGDLAATTSTSKLRAHAHIRFPCCWIREPENSSVSLTPADCVAGLCMARDLGWLQYRSFDVEEYRRDMHSYDICWLVPDQILVGADPQSSIADPDPLTCSKLVPSSDSSVPSSPVLGRTADLGSPKGKRRTDSGLDFQRQISRRSSETNATNQTTQTADTALSQLSCLTQCKAYIDPQPSLFGSGGIIVDMDEGPVVVSKIDDFASCLISKGIKLCVRANTGDEPGLKEIGGSYDPVLLEDMGMSHFDAPFPDKGACLPPPALTRELIERFGALPTPSAGVFFHCKGGFGRSVMYACCLITFNYEVRGPALLGWVRLMRPGAMTCPSQERFVRSLDGKSKIERYMNNRSQCFCSLQ